MERIEEIGFGGLRLIQDTEGFRYGVDAVILADFACRSCPGFRLAVDLGTGNGVIPFIMSHKNSEAEIIGIELQRDAVELARRSCALNSLEARISFIEADVATLDEGAFAGRNVDVVTCNPPYFARGGGIPPGSESRFIARHETVADMEDFIRAAAHILGGRGDFFMVHRPSRLVDIFYFCRKHGLEPKEMRLVTPKRGQTPNIVLVHCSAGGGRELRIMDELPVYDGNGSYSDEIMRIYER